jgi:hypothetical protein
MKRFMMSIVGSWWCEAVPEFNQARPGLATSIPRKFALYRVPAFLSLPFRGGWLAAVVMSHPAACTPASGEGGANGEGMSVGTGARRMARKAKVSAARSLPRVVAANPHRDCHRVVAVFGGGPA